MKIALKLFLVLSVLPLRTIYRAQNIGNVLKRVVNVCQRQRVDKVLGPLVAEFICNFGRENVRSIQHVFHGGLLDPMSAVKIVRHSMTDTHTFHLTLAELSPNLGDGKGQAAAA